jgi:hypothetical protein
VHTRITCGGDKKRRSSGDVGDITRMEGRRHSLTNGAHVIVSFDKVGGHKSGKSWGRVVDVSGQETEDKGRRGVGAESTEGLLKNDVQ